jgi:ABC-type multidrug transport system fused ATPase/permease subunit
MKSMLECIGYDDSVGISTLLFGLITLAIVIVLQLYIGWILSVIIGIITLFLIYKSFQYSFEEQKIKERRQRRRRK